MINIMLVDDDTFFCSMFSNIVAWEEHGCRLVCSVENGQQAIDMFNRQQIDLVFTDMSMPILDGVELIRYITENHPRVKCVALSSYDDFEYVKKSFVNGAIDYQLKHMVTKQSVEEILDHFASEHTNTADHRQTQPGLRDSRDVFFSKLLDGYHYDRTDIDDMLAALLLLPLRKNLFVFLLHIEEFAKLRDRYKKLNKYPQMLQTVTSIMQSILDRLGSGVVIIKQGNDRIYALLTAGCFDNLVLANQVADRFSAQVHSSLKQYLNIDCELLKAPLCRDIIDIRNSHAFLLQKIHEELPDAIEKRDSSLHKLSQSDIRELEHGVRQSDTIALRNVILQHFSLGRERMYVHDQFAMLSNMLIEAGKGIAADLAISHQVWEQEKCSLATYILIKDDIGMQDYVLHTFLNLQSAFDVYLKGKYSPNVYAAVRIMYDRYYEPGLSLNSVSSSIFANPSYLSRIFKAETGTGIVDFLNQYRVKRVMDAMLGGGKTFKESASKCGFENYQYFNKVFKRYVGKTPGEFVEKG